LIRLTLPIKATARAVAFFVVLAFAGTSPCLAAADPATSAYLADLEATARRQQLSGDPQWLRLLHMVPHRLGGWSSDIDTPLFFLSPRGGSDPAAELDATLASFFSDLTVAGESTQCRFKARYEWLRSKLAFDLTRLPLQECTRYEQWEHNLNVGSIAVVFASNDLYHPSSMFGHTLLRLNAADHTGRERLLAYAVNYAADTGHSAALSYALKGLDGQYIGYYSVMPYYEKIRQYEGYDHRDLWEYPLHLTADEQQRLLWHLWELRGVGSHYYFFSRNCSYQLLTLIEAARPDLNLTRDFDGTVPYAIPIDTVRALREAGLLGEPEFHPSGVHQMQSMFEQLPPGEQQWVLDYAQRDTSLDAAALSQLSPIERARTLEVAHQYLYLQYQQGNLSREAGLPLDRAVLTARSQIGEASNFAAIAAPATSPDQGHRSGRMSVGAIADEGEGAAELRWRPAYHDRLDPAGGYLPGAEIRFVDLGLLARGSGVTLSDSQLLSVQAIAPRNAALQPISWQASLGVRRYGVEGITAGGHGALGEYLDGGPGLAWVPLPATQLYVFALASFDANHDLSKDYALQFGSRAGIAAQPAHWLSLQWQADWMGDAMGGGRPLLLSSAQAQFHFSVDDGLRLGLYYGDDRKREAGAVHLTWERYF
jgi:hypothetical protein